MRTDISVTRAHGKTLQVRLTSDEYVANQGVADGRNLPVSTLAREVLMAYLSESDTEAALRRFY